MQHMKKKKRLKTARLALVLTAMLLLPIGAFAQDGLFDRGVSDEDYYGFGGSGLLRDGELSYSLSNQQFGSLLGGENFTNQGFNAIFVRPGITNQPFDVTPLGSGTLILLAAGAGYATVKSRKRNKK